MSRNRQTVLRWIFIPFLFFLWASPAWGAVYKWKDENGRLHFTDDITNVPKKFRPHYTNKKSKPRKKTEKPKTSLGEILKKNSAARDQQTRIRKSASGNGANGTGRVRQRIRTQYGGARRRTGPGIRRYGSGIRKLNV